MGRAQTNPVLALQDQIETQLSSRADLPVIHKIFEQRDLFEAITVERQVRGWTQAHAEAEACLWDPETGKGSERHLTKIEPARFPDWKDKTYLRQIVRYQPNATWNAIMTAYDLVVCVLPWDLYDEILDAGLAQRPPRSEPGPSHKTNWAKRAAHCRAEAEDWLRRAREFEAMAEAERALEAA